MGFWPDAVGLDDMKLAVARLHSGSSVPRMEYVKKDGSFVVAKIPLDGNYWYIALFPRPEDIEHVAAAQRGLHRGSLFSSHPGVYASVIVSAQDADAWKLSHAQCHFKTLSLRSEVLQRYKRFGPALFDAAFEMARKQRVAKVGVEIHHGILYKGGGWVPRIFLSSARKAGYKITSKDRAKFLAERKR